jgi:hypothetical protein
LCLDCNTHIDAITVYWPGVGWCLGCLLISPADSDIDLGLFGSMHQVDLEAITPQQAKKLLYSVLGAIQRADLADGKVCAAEFSTSRGFKAAML